MFDRIGLLLPKKIQKWIKAQAVYTDMKTKPLIYGGKILLTSLLAGIAGIFITYYFLEYSILWAVATGFGAFVVFLGVPLFLLGNSADSEGKRVENILPDALQLIASNIKSGLTTERALFESALPEFGALSNELKSASKKILSGDRIEVALMQIPKKIKSSLLDRTIWLIVQGIKNGGQISNLLVQLSDDLREENALRGEVGANVSMYIMLIFFSAAFGAPALFGISSFIVGVLAEQSEMSNISPEMVAGFSGKNPALSMLGGSNSSISEEFVVFFSEITLFVTCAFTAIVIGIIATGKEKGGVKFIPILLIVSFILFFVVRIMVSSMFGTMAF